MERLKLLTKEVYHVLMVDDDENFLNAHKRLLELIKLAETHIVFRVHIAATGEEAMRILENVDLDCVLIDYMMPEGDGVMWMNRMTAVRPDLPVILLTGAGNETLAVDAMKQGAVDYLIKGGLSVETLEKAIVNAITRAAMMNYIEAQNKRMLSNERVRVMNQTIGAACHHLAQPATILRHCLLIIKRSEDLTEEGREMINQAFKAIDKIYDIIWRLQRVEQYKTEPYLEGAGSKEPEEDNEILSI